MVKTDPTQIASVAGGIAEFDVPTGYEVELAMSFLNYETVTIMPADGGGSMSITLVQMTGVSNLTDEQMQQALEQQGGQKSANMSVVEQRTETIRGEEVIVTVSEGSATGTDVRLRQWMAVFKGNKGPVVLLIQGSTADWDEDLVADFIASIR
jgi:hypothetical protein